jgi:hypothetical protein
MYKGLWAPVSGGANPYMKAPSESDISSSELIGTVCKSECYGSVKMVQFSYSNKDTKDEEGRS